MCVHLKEEVLLWSIWAMQQHVRWCDIFFMEFIFCFYILLGGIMYYEDHFQQRNFTECIVVVNALGSYHTYRHGISFSRLGRTLCPWERKSGSETHNVFRSYCIYSFFWTAQLDFAVICGDTLNPSVHVERSAIRFCCIYVGV